MIYELLEVITQGSRRLVSQHDTQEEAVAALPEGAVLDGESGRYVTEDGRAFVVEAVA